MGGIPSSSAQHPVRHGVGVLLPWEVLRLSRVVRALQGSQEHPRQDWSDCSHHHYPQPTEASGQEDKETILHPSLPSWLERGEGRAAVRSLECPHGKEMCTAVLTQGCLTLLHGAFPSQLHLEAF